MDKKLEDKYKQFRKRILEYQESQKLSMLNESKRNKEAIENTIGNPPSKKISYLLAMTGCATIGAGIGLLMGKEVGLELEYLLRNSDQIINYTNGIGGLSKIVSQISPTLCAAVGARFGYKKAKRRARRKVEIAKQELIERGEREKRNKQKDLEKRLNLGEITETEDGKGYQLNEKIRPNSCIALEESEDIAKATNKYNSGKISTFKYEIKDNKPFPREEKNARGIFGIMSLLGGPRDYVCFKTTNKNEDGEGALKRIGEIIQYDHVDNLKYFQEKEGVNNNKNNLESKAKHHIFKNIRIEDEKIKISENLMDKIPSIVGWGTYASILGLSGYLGHLIDVGRGGELPPNFSVLFSLGALSLWGLVLAIPAYFKSGELLEYFYDDYSFKKIK